MFSPKTEHQHFKWCLVGFEVAMNDKTLHIVCSLCFLMLLTMVTIVPNVDWLIPHDPHVWSLSCLHSPLWNSTWNQTCCTTRRYVGCFPGAKTSRTVKLASDVVNKNHPNKSKQWQRTHQTSHLYHIIFPCVLQLLLVGYYIIKLTASRSQPPVTVWTYDSVVGHLW